MYNFLDVVLRNITQKNQHGTDKVPFKKYCKQVKQHFLKFISNIYIINKRFLVSIYQICEFCQSF